MRAVRVMVGLVGLALALGTGIAGRADEQSVRLACNNFPPHKIEKPADDGNAGICACLDLRSTVVATISDCPKFGPIHSIAGSLSHGT